MIAPDDKTMKWFISKTNSYISKGYKIVQKPDIYLKYNDRIEVRSREFYLPIKTITLYHFINRDPKTRKKYKIVFNFKDFNNIDDQEMRRKLLSYKLKAYKRVKLAHVGIFYEISFDTLEDIINIFKCFKDHLIPPFNLT